MLPLILWARALLWGCPSDQMTKAQPRTIHASCVNYRGAGALILGASGAGKSSLALHLMALGADLVADDRVTLSIQDGKLIASAPAAIEGLIEARGVGLLNAKYSGPATIALVIDLDKKETDRLPQTHHIALCDIDLPLLRNPETPHFSHAILQFLKAGRREST